MPTQRARGLARAGALGIMALSWGTAGAGELLYASEGNRLRRFDIESIDRPPLVDDILIERANLDPGGRDINGQICRIPGSNGRFVAGEDTGQPSPPPGWGVFERDGTQVGKLTATYASRGPEPHGCAFSPENLLFTSEVGTRILRRRAGS
jgi:hypothetical protein